uniref:Glycoprotein n=1 Tax=Panagrolaimus sp. PS1159 TaxID=55785 RepID=A0AC35G9X1_9BILA
KFRGYGNSSNDSLNLDGGYQKQDIRSSDAMLLSDGNEHGIREGKDVKIVRSGSINLTLTEEKVEFEVCDCEGTSTICYESFDSAAGLCGGFSSCEFKVKSNITNWVVGPTPIYKNIFSGCLKALMKSPVAEIESTVGVGFPSCNPKVDDNKMIKLHASINPRCYIRVKNAKLHVPIIQTNSTTKGPPPTKLSQEDISEASSFPDWGYIIIGIVLIVIALIIGVIV